MSSTGLVAMAAVGDRPFVAGLSPWSIWILGVLATVVGSFLFALATYRTRGLPRSGAGLLAIGSAILLVLAIASTTGIWNGIDNVAPTLTLAGFVSFSIGWVALGWTAIRLDQPAVATA
jgi:hypothetical protein